MGHASRLGRAPPKEERKAGPSGCVLALGLRRGRGIGSLSSCRALLRAACGLPRAGGGCARPNKWIRASQTAGHVAPTWFEAPGASGTLPVPSVAFPRQISALSAYAERASNVAQQSPYARARWGPTAWTWFARPDPARSSSPVFPSSPSHQPFHICSAAQHVTHPRRSASARPSRCSARLRFQTARVPVVP